MVLTAVLLPLCVCHVCLREWWWKIWRMRTVSRICGFRIAFSKCFGGISCLVVDRHGLRALLSADKLEAVGCAYMHRGGRARGNAWNALTCIACSSRHPKLTECSFFFLYVHLFLFCLFYRFLTHSRNSAARIRISGTRATKPASRETSLTRLTRCLEAHTPISYSPPLRVSVVGWPTLKGDNRV